MPKFKLITSEAKLPDGRIITSYVSNPKGIDLTEYRRMDTSLRRAYGNLNSRSMGTFL